MTEQDRFYKTQNFLLTPVRMFQHLVEEAIQIVALFVLVVILSVGYPFFVLLGGEGYPLDPPHVVGAFMVAFLTLLTLCVLFYAPYYTFFGGLFMAALLSFLTGLGILQWARPCTSDEGFPFKFLVLGFLLLGILQKYTRNHIKYAYAPAKTTAITQRRGRQ